MAKQYQQKNTNNPRYKGANQQTVSNQQKKPAQNQNQKEIKAPPPAQLPAKISKWWTLGILILISAITFIAYYPSLRAGVTNWDDNSYITDNPYIKEISAAKIKETFAGTKESHPYYMGNYHPLAMLSLAIDFQISEIKSIKNLGKRIRGDNPKDEEYKVDPFVFHLHNVIIHIFIGIFVFFIVFQLFNNFTPVNRFILASFACALFGLHALHVESVTWLSERKDVLYSLYFVISLYLYILYIDKNKIIYFLLSLFVFLLSCLSKGQAVSLSVTLIAIDLLRRRKLLSLRVIGEKIPFFVLSIVFGIIAVIAQTYGEAIHDVDEYGFHYRLLFAAYGFSQYIMKLLVPIHLSAIYPYPYKVAGELAPDFFPFPLWISVVMVILAVAGFILAVKKNKQIAFGIAFFVINIFLLLQLLPVGSAIWADRYAYIPSIGFFIVVSLLLVGLIQKYNKLKYLFISAFVAYCIFLSIRTSEQSKVWDNNFALWDNNIKYWPTSIVAWNNRGSARDKMDDKEGAIMDFTRAINIKPDYTHALYNRGTAKKDLGTKKADKNMLKSAIDDFNKAIKYKPEFVESYHNRGLTLEQLGDLKGAIQDFDKALAIDPNQPNIISSRGVIKGKAGDLNGAIEDFNLSIKLKPENPEAYSNRGFAKAQLGKFEEGIEDYNISLRFKENSTDALFNRAIAYQNLAKYNESLRDYSKLLSIKPNFDAALYYRSMIYITQKQFDKACNDLNQAMNLGNAMARQAYEKYCMKEIKK